MNGYITDTDNLSIVLHEVNDLRLEQAPFPEKLKPSECLLQTICCGICGTDIHLWTEGSLADFVVNKPLVIGHEASATVIAVGEKVKNLKPGDRVAIEPAIPCLKCEFCRKGRYNLCFTSNQRSRGLPPMDGCLRRYFTHSSNFCHKLSDNISAEEGAMCEPFAVIVHAARRVQMTAGLNVLVCGAGTMGLMSLICAKAMGANKVFITDIRESRLALAQQLGADKTYLIDSQHFNDIEMAKTIAEDMGDNPDVTFECSGAESSQSLGIYATKNGGKVAIIGLGSEKSNIPIVFAAMREIDLIGVCRFKDDYQLAIQMISNKKVNLKPLVSHKFKVSEAMDAFKLIKSGSEGVLKVLIEY